MQRTAWHQYELFFTPPQVLDCMRSNNTFTRAQIIDAFRSTYPDNSQLHGKKFLYCVDHGLFELTIGIEIGDVAVAVVNQVRQVVHELLIANDAKSVIRLSQTLSGSLVQPKRQRKLTGWAPRADNPDELVKAHSDISQITTRQGNFKHHGIAREINYRLATPHSFVTITRKHSDFIPANRYSFVPIKLLIQVFLLAMHSNHVMHKRKWTHNDIKPGNIAVVDSKTVVLFDLEGAFPIGQFTESYYTPAYSEKSYYDGKIPIDPASDVFSWAMTFLEMIAGINLDRILKSNNEKYREEELNALISEELQKRGLGMFVWVIQLMIKKDRQKRLSAGKAANKIWNIWKRSYPLNASDVSPAELQKKFEPLTTHP